MSGGVAGRMGLQLALSLILLACNTFDPPDSDPPGDPGLEDMEAGFAPTGGFGGVLGAAGMSGLPAVPPPILRILQRTPAPDAKDVDPQSAIAITFTLPVQAPSRVATLRYADGAEIPSNEILDGATLLLRPVRPLDPGTTVFVELSPVLLTADRSTTLLLQSETRWSFTTRRPSDALELGFPLARLVYEPATHRLYGIDRIGAHLVAVDLATRQRAPEQVLLGAPDDLCLSPDGRRVFVAYRDRAVISEHDAATLAALRELPWPAQRDETSETHFHVRCTENRLLIVDGRWQPALWTLALDTGEVVDRSAIVAGVGDLTPTRDGDEFYYWSQRGWGASEIGGDVHRVSLADFSELDVTELGHPQLASEPLDMPIFLDEQRQRVIAKNFVIDGADLTQIYFEFEKTELIYAVDPQRQRAASKLRVYSLETFLPIADTLGNHAAQQFFDRDGVLYFVIEQWLIPQRF